MQFGGLASRWIRCPAPRQPAVLRLLYVAAAGSPTCAYMYMRVLLLHTGPDCACRPHLSQFLHPGRAAQEHLWGARWACKGCQSVDNYCVFSVSALPHPCFHSTSLPCTRPASGPLHMIQCPVPIVPTSQTYLKQLCFYVLCRVSPTIQPSLLLFRRRCEFPPYSRYALLLLLWRGLP